MKATGEPSRVTVKSAAEAVTLSLNPMTTVLGLEAAGTDVPAAGASVMSLGGPAV